MSAKVNLILGFLPENIKRLQASIESADISKQDAVIKDLRIQINNIVKDIDQMAAKALTLDREKTAEWFYDKYVKACKTTIPHMRFDEWENLEQEDKMRGAFLFEADALIASLQTLLIVEE